MFLADENENNDNESGGIYIYLFLLWSKHCIAPQLRAPLDRPQRSEVGLSNIGCGCLLSLSNCFQSQHEFPVIPLPSHISARVQRFLHLMGVMKGIINP